MLSDAELLCLAVAQELLGIASERRWIRYARRNTIERGFCQLKQWRGLATRYDKHARNYAGALSLAALLTWLP